MAIRWPVAHPKHEPRRHRQLLVLPPELWLTILSLLPRPALFHCLVVSRTFYQLCAPLAFKNIRFHMDKLLFDRCGYRHMKPSNHVFQVDTTGQAHRALQRICSGSVPWAALVETVVVFVRDSSSSEYFRLLSAALQRFTRIKELHVVVTKWHHDDEPLFKPLDQRPIQGFMHAALSTLQNLEVLTIPPMLAYNMLYALVNLPVLRKVFLREVLNSPSFILPQYYTDQLVQQWTNATLGQSFGRLNVLQELCIHEGLLAVVPKDVLHSLKQLEILDIVKSDMLFDVLNSCCSLQSLTIYERHGYSRCITHLGSQLTPDQVDPPITMSAGLEQHRIFYILATRSDILPCLRAFKYVQYHSVLPPEICQYLEVFLANRPRLRKLDINSVITNVDIMRRLPRVMQKMPRLTVLGFEYREPRHAFADVQSILGMVPKTVNYLRFTVHGWDFYSLSRDKRIATVDRVVTQALHVLPHLTFLHLSDGVERYPGEKADTVSLSPSRLANANLQVLGLEHTWYSIEHYEGWKAKLVPWGPRKVYWHMYFEKMSRDAEWLMRYHRDVRSWLY